MSQDLLTITEFRAQVARNRRAAATVGLIACVGVGATLVVAFVLIRQRESSPKPDLALLLPVLAILLLTLAAMMVSLWVIDRRMSKSKPTRCSKCKERLVDHSTFVIATRKCRKCRIQVLADPDGPEEGFNAQLLRLGEFADAARVWTRRVGMVVGAGFAGALIIVVWAFLQPHGGLWVILFWLLVTMGSFVAPLWLVVRGMRRDPRVVCPHCNQSLAGNPNLVVASRNCFRCGRRVLSEPERLESQSGSPAHEVRLLTCTEFDRARRAHSGRLGLLFLVPVLVAVAVLVPLKPYYDDVFGFLIPRYGVWSAVALISTMVIIVAAVTVALMVVFRKRTVRDRRLLCPHCGRLLVQVASLAAVTGNCGHCGRKVLADERPAG